MAEKKKTYVKNGKKVEPKANKGKKDVKKQGDTPSFAYQLIPYIVAVVALFFLICFISNAICNPQNILEEEGRESEHALGIFGFWVCKIMFGVFGPAAYIIPIIMACFVIFWKNYNKRDFVAINAVIAVLTAIVLSAIFHVFSHISGGVAAFSYDIGFLFDEGARSAGGGVVGGILAFALTAILNIGGTIFVLAAVLIPMVMFLVGTTPVAVVSFIAGKVKTAMAKSAQERKEKKEEDELEEKERREEEKAERAALREEERAERAALREEERVRRAEEREAAKAEREARRAAEKDGEKISKEQKEPDAETLNMTEIGAAAEQGSEDVKNENPGDSDGGVKITIDSPSEGGREEKIKMSAFSTEDIRRIDMIKDRSEEGNPFEDKDEDEKGAERVFSEDGERASDEEVEEPQTVVFTALDDDGKRARGYSKVDDLVSERFDEENYEIDEETGEVFTPLVKDDRFKSADEYRAAKEQKDEYFIGDKPEPEPVPEYVFPPISLLEEGSSLYSTSPEEIEKNANILRGVLQDFKINITEINCSCGPTVTRYEVKPEAGVRVKQIANLVDDISYGLAKSGIRIEAPIPGKAAVGIEVPNDKSVPVKLRSLIETQDFINHKSKLAACLGADVSGKPVVFDIEKMPHLLVAGTTGSGKSVCINSIIMSILYHAKPEEVKLLLIDPKKVEFKIYRDIPHLCCRIISDPKKAAGALNSAVNEMEKRFELIEEVGVRNITGYNEATKNDPDKPYMPRMVIIIDEFADLMMTAKDEVETAVVRIAQKARAAGIHLIVGTQRPSVDVITGLIKANIPSRIAFTVMSGIDSRTILDTVGAEKLCGRGDMLYAPVGAQKPQRVQGAFVSDEEVEAVVTYVKEHNAPVRYDQEFETSIDNEAAKCGNAPEKSGENFGGGMQGGSGDEDAVFWDAVELAVDSGKISTSLLQRRLSIGYGRAAKLIDRMEEMGFVSPPEGTKPRKLLITREELAERRLGEE